MVEEKEDAQGAESGCNPADGAKVQLLVRARSAATPRETPMRSKQCLAPRANDNHA